MNPPTAPSAAFKKVHGSQTGGATILLALIILVVMSLAAFAVARNALRDLTIVGTVTQGAKAGEAADAGLDWWIVWSNPLTASTASSATGNKLLVSRISDVKNTDTWGTASNATYNANTTDPYFSGRLWDHAFRISSLESANQTNDMVFDTTNYDGKGSVQQSTTSGNRVAQKFNLTARFLGFDPPVMTSGGGNFSGGTQSGATTTQNLRWQVISEGQASVDLGGGMYQRFTQRREIIGIQALSQTAP